MLKIIVAVGVIAVVNAHSTIVSAREATQAVAGNSQSGLTPTPAEAPNAWGLFAEAVKLGPYVPSTSGRSFASANLDNGTPRLFFIYKVASDGLLYELDVRDQRAWRGEVGANGAVDWTPIHGFYDRGRRKRLQLLGNVLRTEVFNPDGTHWGPWDSVAVPYSSYLNPQHVAVVRAQLDDWERRFDTTIAEIETQGIATDGADDARWARQRRLRESNARASAILNGLGSALSSAQVVASANEAQSRAALDATLAETRRRQGPGGNPADRQIGQSMDDGPSVERSTIQQPTGGGPNPRDGEARAANPQGAPLRFALQLGLRNPVNGINGVCFSNVITIDGPPGWPVETGGEAMALVEPYRERMRRACAARAQLQDSAPAEVVWNSRGRETAPEDNVSRWRAARQIEVNLREPDR